MTIESEWRTRARGRSLATDAHGLTRNRKTRMDSRRTRGTHRTGIWDRMYWMGGNTLGSTRVSRVRFGVPPNCVTKDALNAKKCRQGKNLVGKRCVIRIRSLSFAFGPTSVRLLPGRIIRFRSPRFAYNFFMHDTESRKGSTFAKAMVGRWQFLPGGGERRRAPECATANSPEYVTLAGLIHRDSPQYVTKKICLPR